MVRFDLKRCLPFAPVAAVCAVNPLGFGLTRSVILTEQTLGAAQEIAR